MSRFTPERRNLIVVSLAGTLLVVPWELFMTFGFTFSFREHEGLLAWLFVWFTFVLNIPAVLCSWVWPRVAGWWLVANVTISLVTAIVYTLLHIRSAPLSMPEASELFSGMFQIIYTALFFWAPPLLIAGGLLFMPLFTHWEISKRATNCSDEFLNARFLRPAHAHNSAFTSRLRDHACLVASPQSLGDLIEIQSNRNRRFL